MAPSIDLWSFLPLVGVLVGFALVVVIAVQLLRLAVARRARAAVVPVEPVAELDDTVPIP